MLASFERSITYKLASPCLRHSRLSDFLTKTWCVQHTPAGGDEALESRQERHGGAVRQVRLRIVSAE